MGRTGRRPPLHRFLLTLLFTLLFATAAIPAPATAPNPSTVDAVRLAGAHTPPARTHQRSTHPACLLAAPASAGSHQPHLPGQPDLLAPRPAALPEPARHAHVDRARPDRTPRADAPLPVGARAPPSAVPA
ncbi:hypothetical protein [Goodfellowiella coeruleoviolacea]|uniref:Secreted protein n=1 Tax=Goodfellowiella coeruleoviolacea TaxID=334858 RepID=A0AAE3KFI0_9PSEU|nr:hypothetical protein [Goodfellowiella coeruleoviolacea]MCP2164975.1 hypothetical protein [Goodfellowiella coeruleoviolacea]